MIKTDVAIIGGGPAGLSAAIAAADMGAHVTLVDRNQELGGQLLKQTHMFFGSREEYASTRGFDIANILKEELKKRNVDVLLNTTVVGYYKDDGVWGMEHGEDKFVKLKAKKTVVATGAMERHLLFPNNDLPGIYGAGAVQTLMNQYGVVPGKRVLMVGAGNIGLIVSYQLLQAGVEVAAIIDAAPTIGGYLVHASKVRRQGVPIMTSYTVKKAYGNGVLEGATIVKVDNRFQPIPGTEMDMDIDTMCIAVGLNPLVELLWQAGCEMRYIPQLGGHVPVKDENYETTVEGIYVAGDAAEIEEATSAMVEGRIAGLNAAYTMGFDNGHYCDEREKAIKRLQDLRSGPVGVKISNGLLKLAEEAV
ncbi:MAG: NAD(P)/FAD-dependent oxidoreductase [Thermoanaerobacteraceae bacterium]|nr:NAD(P)/FAD-dependent oxidoreductase [Thermoanaerobacteraceae bacterium]